MVGGRLKKKYIETRWIDGKKIRIEPGIREVNTLKLPDLSNKEERIKFLRFLGGICFKGRLWVGQGRYEIISSHHSRESKEWIDYLLRSAKELFNREGVFKTRKTGRSKGIKGEIVLCSKGIFGFFNFLGFGVGPYAKTINLRSDLKNFLLERDNEAERRAFLEGYISSRATPVRVRFHPRYKRWSRVVLYIHHANPEMDKFIKKLLALEGIKTTWIDKYQVVQSLDMVTKTLSFCRNPVKILKASAILSFNTRITENMKMEDLIELNKKAASLGFIHPKIGELGIFKEKFGELVEINRKHQKRFVDLIDRMIETRIPTTEERKREIQKAIGVDIEIPPWLITHISTVRKKRKETTRRSIRAAEKIALKIIGVEDSSELGDKHKNIIVNLYRDQFRRHGIGLTYPELVRVRRNLIKKIEENQIKAEMKQLVEGIRKQTGKHEEEPKPTIEVSRGRREIIRAIGRGEITGEEKRKFMETMSDREWTFYQNLKYYKKKFERKTVQTLLENEGIMGSEEKGVEEPVMKEETKGFSEEAEPWKEERVIAAALYAINTKSLETLKPIHKERVERLSLKVLRKRGVELSSRDLLKLKTFLLERIEENAKSRRPSRTTGRRALPKHLKRALEKKKHK